MRVHIQNVTDDPHFAVSPSQWEAASARAGVFLPASFGNSDADFAAAIGEAEILIGEPGAFLGRFPTAAPRLRMIFSLTAGVDRLAPFDWLPGGVVLVNNSGVHAAKAGEYVAMALLMLNAAMPALIGAQQRGEWQRLHASTLAGRRLSVIGTGAIGAAAARQGRHFGMTVTGVRSRAEPHMDFDQVVTTVALDEVLPATDFLVLACPLTPATRGLLDRDRLARLPAHAGLVNVGRGALIDEAALCDRLDEGGLAGAVLDVFAQEPVPPGHRLWTTRNLIMTPHVGCDDQARYNAASLDVFFANLASLLAGARPANQVDTSSGY